MTSASFDPKLCQVMFGPLLIQGYGDGTKIDAKWVGDGAKAEVGLDGDAVVIVSHDKRAEVTLELQATGAGRNTLSALMTFFNQSSVNLPLVITSLDTGEVFRAPVAKMKNPPDMSADASMPKRTIVFICPVADLVIAPDATVPFQAL